MVRDMTSGGEAKLIFAFAVPMLFGNIFQQLYNVVDSYVVGQFSTEGASALAAVGLSFPVIFFMLSIMQGIAGGASIIISQYYGAKNIEKVRTAISTSFIALTAITVVTSVIGIIFCRPLLRLIQVPDDIFEMSYTYLVISLAGTIFMLLYNLISFILRSLGDSKTPVYALVITTLINIGLDLWFVIGFGWGVMGVALATVISQAISGVICLVYAYHKIPILRFGLKDLVFDREMLKDIIRVSIPSTIQSGILSLGFMASQGLINSFGTVTIAATTAAGRVDSFAVLPIFSFGMAMATFAGQNVGAGKLDRVRRGYHKCLLMSCVSSAVTGTLLILFGGNLVSFFVKQDELMRPDILRIGTEYLTTVGFFYILFSILNVTSSLLRGAGDMAVSTVATVGNFATRLSFAYIAAYLTPIGYRAIWWSWPVGWGIGALISVIRYRHGGWTKKSLVRGEGGGEPAMTPEEAL